MSRPSLVELLIVLVIVLVLFGVGRISKLGGELGQGVRAFRKGLAGDKDPEKTPKDQPADPDDKGAGSEDKAK